MRENAFDEFADAYEAMIDWPKRLGHEAPFYQWVFERVGAKRVLDAACGTGHHAALMHEWGLTVEGADLSAPMIARCRKRHGESETLRWRVRGFDQPVEDGGFDAAICVGNSLALAGDETTAMKAIQRMMDWVRPGGAVVLHVLNIWRMPDGVCQWQKSRKADLQQGPSLVIKGVHRCGGTGYVDLLVASLADGQLRSECVPFLGLEREQVEATLRSAGAASVETFGSHVRRPYERMHSTDLIAVAIRA